MFKQVRHPTRIIYSTAIAHRLAACYQLPATTIAAQLAAAFCSVASFPEFSGQQAPLQDSSWSERQLEHIKVWGTETGLIQFELDDRAIAAWLDHLIQYPYQLPDDPAQALSKLEADLESNPHLVQQLFVVQHTHARCCSLLRLAHTTGLIILKQPDLHSPLTWRCTNPAQIPWLTSDNRLLLHHPAERRLIRCLLAALDHLANPTHPPTTNTILKLMEESSQVFTSFHAACPLFGISPVSPDHTFLFARLGCLFATQRVLHLLLVSLGCPAPVEL